VLTLLSISNNSEGSGRKGREEGLEEAAAATTEKEGAAVAAGGMAAATASLGGGTTSVVAERSIECIKSRTSAAWCLLLLLVLVLDLLE